MAQQFLDQLVRIPESELSKDCCCMICHRDYGTDSVDFAVRLPCNHDVGFDCISTWLSPERESKNSCPMCRHRFFEAVGEAVGEEEEESWTEVYFRDIVRRVGQPPRVGLAAENATWYDYYVEAAAEQYQESLTRARAFRSTRNPGFDHLPSEQIEHSVACQATAFRTLPVRETLLYIEFGFDEVVPRLEGPIRGPLNAEQSGAFGLFYCRDLSCNSIIHLEEAMLTSKYVEALFQELRRRGAFDIELHPFPYYEGLTDREMWSLHREEGESYSTGEGGFWSLCLA